MDSSKIRVGEIPSKINAVIEIPYGSSVKYELDKGNGAILVDEVMASAIFYPTNCGFIANTLTDDGDPVGILVLDEHPIRAGAVIPCRLTGVLIMEDESGVDKRLLAVPTDKVDARYIDIKGCTDLPRATLNEIKNFFETYKVLKPNKWVKAQDFKDINAAIEILEKAVKSYKA